MTQSTSWMKIWGIAHREPALLIKPARLLLLLCQCSFLFNLFFWISVDLIDDILGCFYGHNFKLTNMDMIVVIVVVAWYSSGDGLDDLLRPRHHPLLCLLLLHLQLVPLQRLEPSLLDLVVVFVLWGWRFLVAFSLPLQAFPWLFLNVHLER